MSDCSHRRAEAERENAGYRAMQRKMQRVYVRVREKDVQLEREREREREKD